MAFNVIEKNGPNARSDIGTNSLIFCCIHDSLFFLVPTDFWDSPKKSKNKKTSRLHSPHFVCPKQIEIKGT